MDNYQLSYSSQISKKNNGCSFPNHELMLRRALKIFKQVPDTPNIRVPGFWVVPPLLAELT